MISIVRTEQYVLNCLWDNPELIYKLDKDYFISSVASALFESLKHLYENDIEFSENQVVIIGNEKHSSITKENVLSLREQEYDISNFDFYFKNLKRLYAKERIENKLLKETLIEVSSKGDLNVEKVRDLILEMENSLSFIEGKDSSLRSFKEISTSYEGILHLRRKGEYKFSTGDSHLDPYLARGFVPGEITTIFGASGVGKSIYALNLVNRQINKRIPSAYFTLEMSEISTMDRLLPIRGNISSDIFQFNDLEKSERAFEILSQQVSYLKSFEDKFFMIEDASLSSSDLELLIREAQKKMKSEYLVATIDLFTMLTDVGQKADTIEEAMNNIHRIAKRTGVHFFLVVQANRSADSARILSIEQINNLRPTANSIKNSAAILERSRLVMSVFRPKYYASRLFPESPELELMEDILEVQILKQNNGQVGKIVRYLYDTDTFRIYPYFDEDSEEVEE